MVALQSERNIRKITEFQPEVFDVGVGGFFFLSLCGLVTLSLPGLSRQQECVLGVVKTPPPNYCHPLAGGQDADLTLVSAAAGHTVETHRDR